MLNDLAEATETSDGKKANCFTELIRGYTMGAVEPYIMMDLQPTGPTRVNLEVIVPSGRPTEASLGCGTRPKVSTSMLHISSSKYHVYSLGSQPREVSEVECFSNDQLTMCQKRSLGNMCKSGSSLTENCVGKHQIPTWLLFRPNAMSSLPQRQKGLTLFSFAIGNSWNDTL